MSVEWRQELLTAESNLRSSGINNESKETEVVKKNLGGIPSLTSSILQKDEQVMCENREILYIC
jgi:hypothetical protein